MEKPEKNRGGRPRLARATYPHRVLSYLDDEGLRGLEALERAWKMPRAAVLRRLITEAAHRERLD